MTVSRFHISGMDCAAEEQLVRLTLSDLDGIDGLEFDLANRNVLVAHDIDPAAIDAALQRLDLGAYHVDDTSEIRGDPSTDGERNALIIAFCINAAFFVGELAVGLIVGSMGLIADALDMGADASVYALSLAAVGTAAVRKKQLARLSGYVQLTLAIIGLVEVMRRFATESELPDPTSMIVVSLLALAGNIVTLLILQRVRTGELHVEASWIFTANDIKVNAVVIAAAVGVALTDSPLPDLIAGAIIFAVVANGARRILTISR
jgi:Co/Zn/Cd efflux system component